MKISIDDVFATDDIAQAETDEIIANDVAAIEREEAEEADPLLNINQLAARFGKRRYKVAELLTSIEPDSIGKKGAKMYRVSRVEDILDTPDVQANASEKSNAQVRKLDAEAGLKELLLEQKRGDVIDVADVEQGAVELFRALHNRLTSYCDDSALDLAKIGTRGEVAAYQKEKVAAILQELRENPNNFITQYLNESTNA